MNKPSGKLYISIDGGFVAVVDIPGKDVNCMFAQGTNFSELSQAIREGLQLHLRFSGEYSNWSITNLTHVQNDIEICISQATLSLKTHEYILRAGLCNTESTYNSASFVSYAFGESRVTFPKFDVTTPKPELVSGLYKAISEALSQAPRTKDHSVELADRIFACE